MKRFLYTLTAFALFATSCNNDNLGDNISLENKTTISVEAIGDDSRTYVENDQIFWSESGEQLNIVYIADESTTRRQSATHEEYVVVDNRATFTADFTTTEGATTYTLGAYSPYKYDSTPSEIDIVIPQVQNSTATCYDPKTDVLVSSKPLVVTGVPNKVAFAFNRMVAFANMTIKGLPAGENIEKIVFSSSAKPAGTVVFNLFAESVFDEAKWYNNYEEITVVRENWVSTGEESVWFTTVPTDLSGKDFTVTVTTDKNIYTKTVDLTGKTLNFERADIAKFSVKDLAIQEKPKAYKLLTDIAELNAGDEVVFCTKKSASSSAKLLSTTADGNALKFTSSITVTDALEIVAEGLPADAALFTVENGVNANTLSFKAAEGYIYGNYENWTNKLSFKSAKDEEATWEVSINSSNNSAWLYNTLHGRYLNNYYDSKFNFAGSQGTYYYYIYYIDGESSEGGETPEQPVVTANVTGNSVVVSWDGVAGAKNYTVTYGTTSFNTTETTVTLNLEYATEYTISVVANPADSTANSASEAGSVTVTTEADPNQGGGEVLSLTLPVEGAVVDATANTFYEGDITISSTGSWRIQSEGSDWSGLFLGSGKNINVAVVDSSKHEITKVEMTAEAGGTLNFGSIGSGSSVTWEPGYGSSSKTFTANGATRVASITVYYQAK